MIEAQAREILKQAIREDRCAELLECLFEGGSCTIDAKTGLLVLASADLLASLWNDDPA